MYISTFTYKCIAIHVNFTTRFDQLINQQSLKLGKIITRFTHNDFSSNMGFMLVARSNLITKNSLSSGLIHYM